VVSRKVEKAQLGTWISHKYGTQSTVSCLAPYVKSGEDIEVLLRNQHLLEPTQPVEICGLSLHRILHRIVHMQEELGFNDGASALVEFAQDRPVLISFPNETVWIARDSATNLMEECFKEIMRLEHKDWKTDQLDGLAHKIKSLMLQYRKTYGFWRAAMTEKFDGVTISRHVIDWTIASSIRVKAKNLAGMTPIIDPHTPGSVALSDRFNRAYLRVLAESSKTYSTPHYFYTINLSPFAIGRDKWTNLLQRIIRMTRAELDTGEFGGVYLSIRNLESISRNLARVRTAKKLIEGLSDAAKDYSVPICWSRAYGAGLAGLDLGVTVSTFQLNLNVNDMFLDGGPSGEDAEEYRFGSVINPWKKECWIKSQVIAAMKSPAGGLPQIGSVANFPTAAQLESSYRYRREFSKPYNLRTLCLLSDDWQRHISDNEVRPGAGYLQNFEPPWCNWGA